MADTVSEGIGMADAVFLRNNGARSASWVGVLGLVALACGGQPQPPAAVGATPEGQPAPTSPSVEPAPARTEVTLYYLDEEVVRTSHCEATAQVVRALDVAEPDVEAVLSSLFAGPSEAERETGIVSPFERTPNDPNAEPLAASFLGAEVEGDTVRLLFRGEAKAYLNAAACAQIAVKTSIERTLRAWGNFREVVYVVDGRIFDEWDA